MDDPKRPFFVWSWDFPGVRFWGVCRFGFRKAEVVLFFGKVCGFLVFFLGGIYAKSAFEAIFLRGWK